MRRLILTSMKKILLPGLITGFILFVVSYGGLWLTVKFFPALFVEYNNPLFNSDGNRDDLFYLHAFIFSFALAWFWDRFKSLFHGPMILRGLEFGGVYAMVALLPVMWISFSALMVFYKLPLQGSCWLSLIPDLAGYALFKYLFYQFNHAIAASKRKMGDQRK